MRRAAIPQQLNERTDCIAIGGSGEQVHRHPMGTRHEGIEHRSGDRDPGLMAFMVDEFHGPRTMPIREIGPPKYTTGKRKSWEYVSLEDVCRAYPGTDATCSSTPACFCR